jgi:hypothetical protein
MAPNRGRSNNDHSETCRRPAAVDRGIRIPPRPGPKLKPSACGKSGRAETASGCKRTGAICCPMRLVSSWPLTLDEYMSAEKFPLTTQKGLSARQQFMIDAFNHDQKYPSHYAMTDEDVRRDAELAAKVAAQPALLREMDEAEKAKGGTT